MKRFKNFWSPEEINLMSTKDIFLMLADLGIPVTKEQFLEDVAICYGSQEIAKRWESQYFITAEGRDRDFPWMSAGVLWQRLAPNKVSTEMLDDMMQEGYEMVEAGDSEGCLLWLDIWEELKRRFTPEMRKLEDADSVFQGSQYLFDWCQDLEQELHKAAIYDETFHDHRIRYCREFCEFFPEDESFVAQMKRSVAESLYLSGRTEEADLEFQACAEAYIKDPWSYIIWGDMYAGENGQPCNPDKAEALYRKALGIHPREDENIRVRIAALRKRP